MNNSNAGKYRDCDRFQLIPSWEIMAMTRQKDRRVALYLRVSTSEQTTNNQRRELEAVAERHGWHVVSIFEDAGISGAKG